MAAIFRHQMAAPLAADLGQSPPGPTPPEADGCALEAALPANPPAGAAPRFERLAARVPPAQSFAELLRQPRPAVGLLEVVKEFAKANADNPQSGLPREVAAVLYYACIGAALVRLGSRISKLSDEELRRGLSWAAAQPWVDEETGRLLGEALAQVTPGGARADSGS
jgi:hypothetical protein